MVPNRRQDVQFALVRGGVIQAVSPVVTNAAPNLPGGVKAVPEKTPAAFTVQWQTLNASQPRVLWGTSPSALSSAANATTTTYTKADLVSACTQGVLTAPLSGMTAALQGWTAPGSIHKALLSGLQPDTTYYYQARGRRRGAAAVPARLPRRCGWQCAPLTTVLSPLRPCRWWTLQLAWARSPPRPCCPSPRPRPLPPTRPGCGCWRPMWARPRWTALARQSTTSQAPSG